MEAILMTYTVARKFSKTGSTGWSSMRRPSTLSGPGTLLPALLFGITSLSSLASGLGLDYGVTNTQHEIVGLCMIWPNHPDGHYAS